MSRFAARLEEIDITSADVAVLCRGGRLCEIVNSTGGAAFSGRLADLAELAHAMQHDGPLGAPLITGIETDLADHAWPDITGDDLSPENRIALRQALLELGDLLPNTDLVAKQWGAAARTATQRIVDRLTSTATSTTLTYKAKVASGAGEFVVSALLAGRQGSLTARAIHTVKGESYDATLTIADKNARIDNAADWLAATGEERRIAYVALTRARSYAAFAIPHTCNPFMIADFQERGFVRLP